MWHTTCTQENWSDSRLLVVGSQIANLTFSPFFDHKLCFRYPNGSCEPIFDIYVPRTFHWYNELFNSMGFDFAITISRFGIPSGLQLPRWELTWECGGSFPHTLSHSHEHEIWLPGFTLGLHLHKSLPWSRTQG